MATILSALRWLQIEKAVVSMVCFIHSFPGASDTLALLWSGFKNLECPIIGVDCIDGACRWPELTPTIRAGYNRRWQDDPRNLPTRLLNTLRFFLATAYKRAIIAEYDVAFLDKPDIPDGGLVMHRAGGQLPNTPATQFFHFPYIIDRATAREVVTAGTNMILDGECEKGAQGSPDVFMGRLIDLTGMPWVESGWFSANTIVEPFIEPAHKAYLDGCKVFHGVKEQVHLDNIIHGKAS